MRLFRFPRCCEVAAMGRAPHRRYVWQLGQMKSELAAELSGAAVEQLAAGIEALVGRATFRSQSVLPCPAPDGSVRLGPLTLELVEQDVRITAWPDGAEVSGPVPPEPPALVVLIDAQCARAVAHSCRAALAHTEDRCPFCGEALKETGHVCPRANGYRR